MGVEKRLDAFRFVRREIVDDDMDRSPTRLRVDDVLQEVDERLAGMARHRLPDDLAGLRVERRIQGERAVAVVLKAMAFGAARREGQYRIEAIQCLDGGLF